LVVEEDAENDDKCTDILEEIVDKLIKRQGIQIAEYRVTTLEEMTAKELINSQYWDFDHLSYREES
jgi:hypothetical protein